MTVYTIGHSTRDVAEFVDILKQYSIDLLVDVRTMPRSRRVPQFNSEELAKSLTGHGIDYLHLAELGGLRSTNKDSINTAWRNKSFRGYADYMQTDEFAAGIDKLINHAKSHTVAIMCAEAVPWRCHRSLVGDALLVRGVKVVDIFDKNKSKEETLTSFAKVDGLVITYPKQ